MALRVFVGKPRAGKSSGALKEIIAELINGQRFVVTNLSIDMGKLAAFLDKRYPANKVDLHFRLRLLTNHQCKQFWLYRNATDVLPGVTKEQEDKGIFPDFGLFAGNGVFFVIDEAHIMFDSRSWQESGKTLTFYNSQHGKLNDETIFITQFVELIDKRVRGFAQEFWYFRNAKMAKVYTFFRAPGSFIVKVYEKPVTGHGDPPANEVHKYPLDKEMCDCYDTSAGVGITGRNKPEHNQKKGLSIWWISVPVILAAVAIHQAPDLMFRGAKKITQGASVTAVNKEKVNSLTDPGASVGFLVPRGTEFKVPQGQQTEQTVKGIDGQELYVRGITMNKGRINVVFSDGTIHTEDDGTLQKIGRKSVVLRTSKPEGQRLFLRNERLVAASGPVVQSSTGGTEKEKAKKDSTGEKKSDLVGSSAPSESINSNQIQHDSEKQSYFLDPFPRTQSSGFSGGSGRVSVP